MYIRHLQTCLVFDNIYMSRHVNPAKFSRPRCMCGGLWPISIPTSNLAVCAPSSGTILPVPPPTIACWSSRSIKFCLEKPSVGAPYVSAKETSNGAVATGNTGQTFVTSLVWRQVLDTNDKQRSRNSLALASQVNWSIQRHDCRDIA